MTSRSAVRFIHPPANRTLFPRNSSTTACQPRYLLFLLRRRRRQSKLLYRRRRSDYTVGESDVHIFTAQERFYFIFVFYAFLLSLAIHANFATKIIMYCPTRLFFSDSQIIRRTGIVSIETKSKITPEYDYGILFYNTVFEPINRFCNDKHVRKIVK